MFGDGFILPRFSIVVVVDESSAGDSLFDVDGGISKVVKHNGESEGFTQSKSVLSFSKGRRKASAEALFERGEFLSQQGQDCFFPHLIALMV